MEDVARRAGVALGTVSNVLNRPSLVSAATRSRVQQVIDELGFAPNRAARALAAGTSSTIGFVVIDLSNSFFLDMARGAEQTAETAGMTVVLGNADVRAIKQRTYLDLFVEEQVAGILLAPLPETAADAIGRLPPGRRLVFLNDSAVDGACTVSADDEHGGYLAARHLIELGRRRLAFAGDPAIAVPVRDRLRGVERAVAESNGAVSLELDLTPEVQVEDGRRFGHLLADRAVADRPDGVVAAADLLALGVLQSLLARPDLRVPEDIAVTGYDDNRSAWDSVVPITTLAQPGEAMGEAAMRLLLDEISDPQHVHRHEVLRPRLVVRGSTVPR
ncbi:MULTISPECIES: LacI family DNA-binding transcriptional regulator [unclassified Rathayibacter]|uniref:LacI family DNA-binding transcriptional regulator n=1 Tax=unclassified Rathayibacter TaxID=2609250 RepID=UPI000CE766A1|nr:MULTISPECIES: LacI family DNA-binding transcriptional regulator [unclassified Rathayibacter]PPG08132.1 LacI family transcriptional regulator [Rathayibacter sp. AY2B1]PPG68297.1 LacI family transcriptional regulator [Rathayibacter sp. AY1F4]PPH51680.1 LacI family transcriptional regulator [Rathayibacter sp. AY1E2]